MSRRAIVGAGICIAALLWMPGCSFMRERSGDEAVPTLGSDPWKDAEIGPIPEGKLKIEDFSDATVFYLTREYTKLMPEAMDMIVYTGPAYLEVRNVRFRGMLNDFNNARMKADRIVVRIRELPDGRKKVARIEMSGNPKFTDDRDQIASGPLEIDIETSTLTANGKHKALMSR